MELVLLKKKIYSINGNKHPALLNLKSFPKHNRCGVRNLKKTNNDPIQILHKVMFSLVV